MFSNGMRVLLLLLLVAPLTAQAQSETTVSRLYLVNPDSTDIKGSVEALEAAIKTRDFRPSKQIGLMPSELPDHPGEIESRPFNFGPASITLLSCGNSAYAQIGTSTGTNAGLIGNTSERIFGCLYLSKRGIRMAMVIEQRSSTSGSLMGSLMSGIKNVARGNDVDYTKKLFDAMLQEVRVKIPGVLVELQELSSGEVTRPDEEKVKALALSSPPPAAPPAVAKAVEVSAATTTERPSSTAQALDARRQLTGLGLTYYSLEQFHDAIKRKDAIAVDLFLKAKSVDLSATSNKGETTIHLAKRVNDPEIIRMIEQSASQ